MSANWLLMGTEALKASKRTCFYSDSVSTCTLAGCCLSITVAFMRSRRWTDSAGSSFHLSDVIGLLTLASEYRTCWHARHDAEGLKMIYCWLASTFCIYWYVDFCFVETFIIPRSFAPVSLFRHEMYSVEDKKTGMLKTHKSSSVMIHGVMCFSRLRWMRLNKCYWLPLQDPILLWNHTVDCCLRWKQRHSMQMKWHFSICIIDNISS